MTTVKRRNATIGPMPTSFGWRIGRLGRAGFLGCAGIGSSDNSQYWYCAYYLFEGIPSVNYRRYRYDIDQVWQILMCFTNTFAWQLFWGNSHLYVLALSNYIIMLYIRFARVISTKLPSCHPLLLCILLLRRRRTITSRLSFHYRLFYLPHSYPQSNRIGIIISGRTERFVSRCCNHGFSTATTTSWLARCFWFRCSSSAPSTWI